MDEDDKINVQGQEVTPLLVLIDDVGEGEVVVTAKFPRDLSSLAQADLLQDWIDRLEDMYDSVTGGTFLEDLGATEINETPPSGRKH